MLGFAHLHYFHGIYPFMNLLAAVAAVTLVERYEKARWARVAVVIAIVYQAVWHVLPLPMRRKNEPDFYQLKAVMSALHQRSPELIETLGIAESDWVYRQMSQWYWDWESRVLNSKAEIRGGVIVMRRGTTPESEMNARGFQRCSGSKNYEIFVRTEELLGICRKDDFDKGALR
jgi:membrane protein YdbS with pleckstrin-like domain